jgi:hypothetical protein
MRGERGEKQQVLDALKRYCWIRATRRAGPSWRPSKPRRAVREPLVDAIQVSPEIDHLLRRARFGASESRSSAWLPGNTWILSFTLLTISRRKPPAGQNKPTNESAVKHRS